MKPWMIALLLLASCSRTAPNVSETVLDASGPVVLEQGWRPADRAAFYTTGQGSQIIPAAWFAALQRANSVELFASDRLARYGYLPNGAAALPIGFVVDPASNELGMTCAACHTGAIKYKGQTWRTDGGRANADFQRFLADLTQAMRATLEPERFAAFARRVVGADASLTAIDKLQADFRARTDKFGTFMDKSLPAQSWGNGRLDAFGMIFNRVTALDLGISDNYHSADAPVRYPFLWNAVLQDATQWDGAAPNGNFVKGLARNTGEVFGVFAVFAPRRLGPFVTYENSADFGNLQTLEEKVAALKPPAWPREAFGFNAALAARGTALFESNCASCHGKQPSQSVQGSWATPVCRVGTDPTMFERATLEADSGLLAGTPQLSTGGVLGWRAKKLDILANAVIGSLVRDVGLQTGLARAVRADIQGGFDPNRPGVVHGPTWLLPSECSKAPPRSASAAATAATATATTRSGATAVVAKETAGLYQLRTANGSAPNVAAYEARVLNGIWAVAPYLHNGSVPTLWQLLVPARDRVKTFPTGLREFDPVDVGVAAAPRSPDDFDTRAPNNSNAGHEYGTDLPEADRRALLEYLKVL